MKKYLKAVFLVGWRIIFAYFAWMIRYSRHPEKYPIEVRFGKVQKLAQRVLKAFNVVYDIQGLEEFYKNRKENENQLIVCNHLADTDPIVLMALCKKPIAFVAKKESEKFPFVGRIVKCLGGEFLDRGDLKQELRVMMRIEKRIVSDENLDFVIYPEGTRNKDYKGGPLQFKYGTFRPAMKTGVPFTIFSVYGTNRVLSKKFKNKYNPIQVRCIKTYTKEEYADKTTAEMALIAHDIVKDNVAEMVIKDKEMMHSLNKKHQDD